MASVCIWRIREMANSARQYPWRRSLARYVPAIVLSACLAGLASMPVAAQDPRATFRAGTDAVNVDVAVQLRNNPVLGLQSDDFQLYDNGVLQRIDATSRDSLPVDVSIVADTSGSVFTEVDQVRRVIETMVRMLSPSDRFRVLTMGNAVVNAIPWQVPNRPNVSAIELVSGQISLVYDAVVAALFHGMSADRRHLVIVFTDGIDICSLVSPNALRSAAERSGAVLHWVRVQRQQESPKLLAAFRGAGAFCRAGSQPLTRDPQTPLQDAVERTGGTVFPVWFGAETLIVNAFERVLEDYRTSYVLQYVPQGVELAGWHTLRVEVKDSRYVVRSRPGYWGPPTTFTR